MLFRFIALIPLLSLSSIALASTIEFQSPPISEQLFTPVEMDLAALFQLPEDPTIVAARSVASAAKTLDPAVALRAVQSALCAQDHGLSVEKLIIIDMNSEAIEKRLWAFDVKDPMNPLLVLNDRVAHGSGSDPGARGLAQRFSNTPNSHMTSLGLYKVAERYQGKNGWSRRLDGLFSGFNSKARERAVVMHPSNYVSAQRVARSQGCPAVNQETMDALETAGLTNAVLWIDGPDQELGKAVAECARAKQAALLADAMAAHYERVAATIVGREDATPAYLLAIADTSSGAQGSEINACREDPQSAFVAWRRRTSYVDSQAPDLSFT